MSLKKCNKCELEKDLSEFYFRKDSGKHRNSCISCEKNRLKVYYSENSDTRKYACAKYYNENKEEYNKKYAKYRKTEKRIKYTKEYNKKYRAENKEKIQLNYKIKITTNSLFKLKENIRGLISQYFKNKGYKKSSKTAQILGCTFEEFKIHIESQFESWMNWSNHGLYSETEKRWQLDHIIPASSAKDEAELIRLNHYSNFQPLCAKENNWKSDKIMTQGQDKKDEE